MGEIRTEDGNTCRIEELIQIGSENIVKTIHNWLNYCFRVEWGNRNADIWCLLGLYI